MLGIISVSHVKKSVLSSVQSVERWYIDIESSSWDIAGRAEASPSIGRGCIVHRLLGRRWAHHARMVNSHSEYSASRPSSGTQSSSVSTPGADMTTPWSGAGAGGRPFIFVAWQLGPDRRFASSSFTAYCSTYDTFSQVVPHSRPWPQSNSPQAPRPRPRRYGAVASSA